MESYGYMDFGYAEDVKAISRYDAATDTWEIESWLDEGHDVIDTEFEKGLYRKAMKPEEWKRLVDQFEMNASEITYIRGEDY